MTAGNKQLHTIKLYSGNQGFIDQVVVNPSGLPTGFQFAALSGGPYTLDVGNSVWILSTEANGGGNDNIISPNLQSVTVADIGLIQQSSLIGGTWTSTQNGNTTYGPVTFKYSAPVPSWTKNGTIYSTDGNYYQIKSALADASSGDTVSFPTGNFDWGVGGSTLSVPNGVNLVGGGSTSVVTIPIGGPSGSNTALIAVGSNSIISDFAINGPTTDSSTPFQSFGTNGWRLTRIVYTQQAGAGSYFIRIDNSRNGLIDHCTINGADGTSEMVFARGPTNAWDNDNTMGAVDNIFIEDNIFNGVGYISDANSNARVVIRNNVIAGSFKADAHGLASNNPSQSFRNMEVYSNNWTYTGSVGWTAMEIRGATSMIFRNRTSHAVGAAAFYMTDYGYLGLWPNYGGVPQTPVNYPLGYQVGAGKYVTIDATGIVPYQMVKIATFGTTDFAAIGATGSLNVVGGQFIASGIPTGNGTVQITPAATEPAYIWDNLQTGIPWARGYKSPQAQSIALYKVQTANTGATFNDSTCILSNRDFYAASGFDTNIGVVTGSASQLAGSPPLAKHGFWVDNTGSWNTTLPANTYGQGQLYTGNGSQWVLAYTPYQYPHPLQASGSSVTYVLKRLGRYLKFKGYAPA